jgi:hypothetical protein
VNDAGFQTSVDDITTFGFINWRSTKPGRVFRFAFAGNNLTYNRTFDGVNNGLSYNANLNGTFLNYWNGDAHFTKAWRVLSDNLTRGGPLATLPFLERQRRAGIRRDAGSRHTMAARIQK